MRKTLLLLALLLFGAASAQATLAPLNVQRAHIETGDDNRTQLTVGFDWFHDHVQSGATGAHARGNSLNLPRIDWRHSFDTAIPTRIGINTGLSAGTAEITPFGSDAEIFENSAFGFNNLGLTLEAALVNEDDISVTAYINQHFALIHNGLQTALTLRPVNGVNAYGFQTGLGYEFNVIDDDDFSVNWFGDIGYRFDVPDTGSTQHSLVYYNEMVAGGDNFGVSLGLLGNSVYTSGFGTDLRLVPGVIAGVGDDGNTQVRVGFPIGLNPDSPDFGVQASVFSTY